MEHKRKRPSFVRMKSEANLIVLQQTKDAYTTTIKEAETEYNKIQESSQNLMTGLKREIEAIQKNWATLKVPATKSEAQHQNQRLTLQRNLGRLVPPSYLSTHQKVSF